MPVDSLRHPIRYAGVLNTGQTIALDKPQLLALQFREINVKEAFTLVDSRGQFFRASLTTTGAVAGGAHVYESMGSSPESSLHLTLLCAVLARQRMLGVIQKASELGVMAVVPVLSE